jgi:hypothetical protein
MQISDLPASENIQSLVEDRIKLEYFENEDFQSINYFYLFFARTYALLNSDDSGFLAEFAFMWDESFPR